MSANTIPVPADLISLAEAAKLLPSRKPGRRLHCSVLYRWTRQGKLMAWRVGGHLFVSRADILNLPKPVEGALPELVTQKQREAEIEESKAILRANGFKT